MNSDRITCPKCGGADQYGDSCDKCMETYSAVELQEPFSTLSGATPELRTAPHKFIQLNQLREFLGSWVSSDNHLQKEIANYVEAQFLSEELRDWDVTRPPEYFGFEVPDFPGHSWYVWFDAPIGYLASTRQWCDRNQSQLSDWWQNPDCEVHHFIGKDITKFHTLFWPAVLKTAGFSLPRKIHIHGFLKVAGEKMSKSRGTSASGAGRMPPDAPPRR